MNSDNRSTQDILQANQASHQAGQASSALLDGNANTIDIKDKILRFYEKYMILMGSAGHFIFIFQTHKMIVNNSASGVSLEGFCIAFLSIISWLFYGALKKDRVLIAVNIFGLIAALVCITAIFFLS